MKKILIGLILIILALFVVACTPQVAIEKQCNVDSDCVPASCCHPNESISKNYAPACADILCSMECEPNTLDCGQGEVKCVSGECKVVIK